MSSQNETNPLVDSSLGSPNENLQNSNRNGENSSQTTTDLDRSDEMYLHHSDPPSLKLSTTLLNDFNYSRWKRSVEVALIAKNKLGFVTGECKRPVSDAKLITKWEQCNSMLISWLLHSVEKDIAESILFCKSAAQIWKELGSRYGKSKRTNLFQIQKELSCISQGNSSITVYFTRLKKLWDEYLLAIEHHICSCGSNEVILSLLKDQQVIQFLVGLNDSFAMVRSNILMMTPSPSLDEVYKMIIQDEGQRGLRSIASVDQDSTALYSQQRGFYRSQQDSKNSSSTGSLNKHLFCDHCKQKNHTIDKCWKLNGYPTAAAPGVSFCDHCKIAGHVRDRCWKLHGYPAGHRLAATAPSNISPDQLAQLLALLSKSSPPDSKKEDHTAFLSGPFDEASIGDW